MAEQQVRQTQGEAQAVESGEFAVLLFRATFDKAPDSGESVTLERDKDGAWRVVGYFIR